MSPSKYPTTREHVYDLTDRQIQGSLDAVDGQSLELLLVGDPTLRRAYLQYVLLHGQLSLTVPAIDASQLAIPSSLKSEGNVFSRIASAARRSAPSVATTGRVAAAVAALVLLTVSALLFRDLPVINNPRLSEVNLLDIHYQTRILPLHVVGTLQSIDSKQPSTHGSPQGTNAHLPTTLRVLSGEQQFLSSSDVRVRTQGPTLFGISSAQEGTLYCGAVQASLPATQDSFSIRVGDLRVMGRDSDFRVSLRDKHRVLVQAERGPVQIETRNRRPLCWWNFDGPAEGTPDVDGSTHFGAAARLVDGIVGRHAVSFDNTQEAFVELRHGTGSTVGSGELSCGDAITIEAMIMSRWRGDRWDYDEIFRKDDSEYRVLLSFQNDGYHAFDDPPVPDGPVLSFGLYLDGHGYRELDMPLDGQAGRPTVDDIADGHPHHIVATYDSSSGQKRLFIDGLLRYEYTYPRGTMIVCGGPEPAQIGNYRGVEPFHGTIDEVAYYDLALTATEVANHWSNARLGEDYFGPSATNSTDAPPPPSITVEAGESLELDLSADSSGSNGSIY